MTAGVQADATPERVTVADIEAKIIAVGEEQGGVWSALLLAPEIAQQAEPMQFVQVKVGESSDPFLRRPFGISRIDREAGLIGITWAVVGRGTSMMTAWEPGDTVTVLGPLGNGFEPPSSTEMKASGSAPHPPVWLIGGGTGLAPLYPLAKVSRELCEKVALFYGARSAGLLMDTAKFADLGCEVHLATEDGSAGTKGFVTAAVEKALKGWLSGASASASGMAAAPKGLSERAATANAGPALAVACGPTPMLRAVKAQLAGKDIDLYVSLEERMACGTGLCRGCAVKAAPPREGYLHVCSDGPVFPANDVILGGEK